MCMLVSVCRSCDCCFMCFNHLCLVDSSTIILWTSLFNSRFLLYFIELPVFNANSVDSEQTLRSVVFIVFKSPFQGTLAINGLMQMNMFK